MSLPPLPPSAARKLASLRVENHLAPVKKDRAYHSDPEILGGDLVFKGTRVPVQSLFDHLKAGDSIEVFLDGFPSVKRSQVLAVIKEMETDSCFEAAGVGP